MKYAYIGDHEGINVDGVTFPANVFVEVASPMLLYRLPRSRVFKAEQIEVEEEVSPPIIAPEKPVKAAVKRGRKAK